MIRCSVTDESYKHEYGVDTVIPDDIFERNHISLAVARRDWAAFQVLLQGTEDFILSVGNRPVFSPKGPLLNVRVSVEAENFSREQIELCPIGFVEDDDRMMKADILLHDEVIYVENGKIQPVWVEIRIPEDMAQGTYKGLVHVYAQRMFEPETEIRTIAFDLVVKDLSLPPVKDYSFHLDLWQHLSNIARKHEVFLWSEEHFRVIEEYVKSLAQLGQKAVTIVASEIPWSGQNCFRVTNYPSDLFEYNIIQVVKDKQGNYHYDYSAMDRYIQMCFDYGIDREIEVFGLTNIWIAEKEGYGGVCPDYPDAIRIRYLDKRDGCYRYMDRAEDIKQYIKALETHFLDMGWMDKVLVVADEPSDVDLYRKRLDLIKEMAPAFSFKTAINHVEFIEAFRNQIRDFVPILPCVCEGWEELKKLRTCIQGRLLWYVCCWPPLPNTFVGSPLVESRLIGLLTAFLGLDGFLRWNYTVWPERPRERISYRYPSWKAGDTHFVYPAWDGRPLLTLRYKQLKRGIEDYELISLLKKAHPAPETVLEKIWEKVLRTRNIMDFHPDSGKKRGELYSLSYRDYQDAREMLLDELGKCGSKRM